MSLLASSTRELTATAILRNFCERFGWEAFDEQRVYLHSSGVESVARYGLRLTEGDDAKVVYLKAVVRDGSTDLYLDSSSLRRFFEPRQLVGVHFARGDSYDHLILSKGVAPFGGDRDRFIQARYLFDRAGGGESNCLRLAYSVTDDVSRARLSELGGDDLVRAAASWLHLPSRPGWETRAPVEAMVGGVMKAAAIRVEGHPELDWSARAFAGDFKPRTARVARGGAGSLVLAGLLLFSLALSSQTTS